MEPSAAKRTSSQVAILPLEPEHHDAVMRLLEENFRKYSGSNPRDWKKAAAAHRRNLSNPGWVAVDGRVVVGFATTKPKSGRHYWATLAGIRELWDWLNQDVSSGHKQGEWKVLDKETEWGRWYPDSLWGQALAVDPSYRNQGIATRLIHARDSWAREHGFRAILTTCVLGTGLPELYASLGYEPIIEMENDYYPNGDGTRLMVLRLGAAAKRPQIGPIEAFNVVGMGIAAAALMFILLTVVRRC